MKIFDRNCRQMFLASAVVWQLATTTIWAQEANWPRFRGPNGAGVAQSADIPSQWGKRDYAWQIELPGIGISSPVAWGDKVFITSADGDAGLRYLSCLRSADGSTLWQREFAFEPYKKHKNNTFATNTPAVDAQHVYQLWQSRNESMLLALDHDGREVWQFDLGPYKSGHGTGSSPIVFNRMVIVSNDQDGESFLLAVDAATGKQVWKTPRTGDRACYSTPCVFQPNGDPAQLIFTHSYRGITGVAAETGERLWEIDVFGTHQQRAVASPLVYQDLVIGSSGFTTAEKNVVAVRPRKTSDVWQVDEVYRLSKTVPHVPTPVIYQDWMFLLTDTGILNCVRAADGEMVWQKRIGGNFHSSPVCIDGRIFCVSREGTVSVVAAAGKFELLGTSDLGETCSATPAVVGKLLLLRGESRLFAIAGERAAKP